MGDERSEAMVGILIVDASVMVYFIVRFILQVLSDVLSVAGFLYAIGLGSSAGLNYPGICRGVIVVMFVELCALAGMLANFIVGRWKYVLLWDWLLGHITFVGWLVRAARWTVMGVSRAIGWAYWKLRRSEKITVTESVEMDDWSGTVIDLRAA